MNISAQHRLWHHSAKPLSVDITGILIVLKAPPGVIDFVMGPTVWTKVPAHRPFGLPLEGSVADHS